MAILALTIVLAADPLHWDFESTKGWKTGGALTASVVDLRKSGGAASEPASKHGVKLLGFGSFRTTLPAGSMTKVGAIEFWTYRMPSSATQMDVVFSSADNGQQFRATVKLVGVGWRKHSLPLAWFRWGDGGVPRWKEIAGLAFRFLRLNECYLADVRLVDGSPIPTDRMIAEALFPKPERVRVVSGEYALVMTDAWELREPKLLEHLERVAKTMREELQFLSQPELKPRLCVFEQDSAYREFPSRLAAKRGLPAEDPPTANGRTIEGIAAAAWDPKQGALRPVYTHEFVHAMLAAAGRIPNQGDWLQEGLATRYQLKFHPQPELNAAVAAALPGTPLGELCNGRPVAQANYWQAETVASFLVDDPLVRRDLATLVTAIRDNSGTQLEPHLKPVFNMDWERFTARWIAYARKRK